MWGYLSSFTFIALSHFTFIFLEVMSIVMVSVDVPIRSHAAISQRSDPFTGESNCWAMTFYSGDKREVYLPLVMLSLCEAFVCLSSSGSVLWTWQTHTSVVQIHRIESNMSQKHWYSLVGEAGLSFCGFGFFSGAVEHRIAERDWLIPAAREHVIGG